MFDIAPSELLLVAFVALVVIGPKDLPKAMRVVGYWVGKARGVARQFRSGFDSMVREAELEEMEKRWASENARIMSEHPATADTVASEGEPAPVDTTSEPVLVEKPAVIAAPASAEHAPARAGEASS
ncbi:Sec-independent protein translocase protein TatB [Sphingomonas sp.]|uniref:Sec-independent protein translocase protein TatB n=1 Tax=Sphingomonas sp. TaxID=28214 RepID=UPI0035BBD7F1